jgi:hypothetical protein
MMSGTRSLQESVRTAVNKVSGQAPVAAPPAVEEPKMIGQSSEWGPAMSSDKSSAKSSGKSSAKSSGKSSKSGKKKK